MESKLKLLNDEIVLLEKNIVLPQNLVYTAANDLREIISKEKLNIPDILNEDLTEIASIGNQILQYLNVTSKVSTIKRLGSLINKPRPSLVEIT